MGGAPQEEVGWWHVWWNENVERRKPSWWPNENIQYLALNSILFVSAIAITRTHGDRFGF